MSKSRLPIYVVLVAAAMVLVFSGCAAQSAPGPTAVDGPTAPIHGPADFGSSIGEPHPIEDLPTALACIAAGQPAYAVMSRNTNVRTEPRVESCRLGRAPAQSVIRIEAVVDEEGNALATANPLDHVTSLLPVGYEEDVQPIFQATCNSCHGDTVQTNGLRVTDYDSLLAGSDNGPVVTPGKPEESLLWRQIANNVMPLVGELTPIEKEIIHGWILAGAPKNRPDLPNIDQLWLQIHPDTYNVADNNTCAESEGTILPFVNARYATMATCGLPPTTEELASIVPAPVNTANAVSASVADGGVGLAAPPAPAGGKSMGFSATRVGIQAAPLGLPVPSESDPWLVPQGGFCIEQRLQRLENNRGITSMAFAPDGRLFLGLDSLTTGDVDPNILFDAFHPSRSIAVYNSVSDDSFYEILQESSRVTGLVYQNGALYISRAGEVGRIVDGGGYERLAAGFPVNGRLFHANNGITIVDGWLYVSVGGVRDGFSDGIIAPESSDPPAETVAVNIAAGGNPYGARLVRASLDRLVNERDISVFQTAARGFRNPYGLTRDPFGRLWITDNGATNVPGEYGAGDEVDLFDPRTLSGAAAAGDESATPYYGFPIVLSGLHKDWYTDPVVELVNTAAPTGITWANNTVYFAQYGKNPGLYRLANAGGRIVAERVLLLWPIQAVATAPDGAIWVGTGGGGLYRLAPGCN